MRFFYMNIICFFVFATIFSCHENIHYPANTQEKELMELAKDHFDDGLNNIEYFGKMKASVEIVELGKSLFFDPRISRTGTVSCSRCHLPQLHFTDGLSRSIGTDGIQMPRNSPTLLNAAGQFSQHWAGERKDVEHQAKKSFFGRAALDLKGSSHFKEKLINNGYDKLFRKAYNVALTKTTADKLVEMAADAIGSYERALVAPSKMDDFLSGSYTALNISEKRGLKKFIEIGCSSCHSGILVGGNSYQKFGIFDDYVKHTKSTKIDFGRYAHTKDEGDKFYFKVPSLRNVASTPPYFHDGSVKTLDEAIRIMGKIQLGVDISKKDRDDLITFLKSLNSKENELDSQLLNPTLP